MLVICVVGGRLVERFWGNFFSLGPGTQNVSGKASEFSGLMKKALKLTVQFSVEVLRVSTSIF